MLKYPRQQIYRVFASLWETYSSEMSVLVLSEILRLFVKILTPDDKYSLSVKERS